MVDAARSGWARELRAAVALHDLAAAGARMLGAGGVASERLEQARLGVAAVCERAEAAGVGEAELDRELAAIRREQLSTMSVLRAVDDVGRERERTARSRGHDTDRLQLGWATSDDLAARLGVARRDVQPLVDHALDTGLVYRVRETATFGSPPLHAAHQRKVERLQQTMDREWARGLTYRSSADRRAALPHWLDHYNGARRHSALGNRPPLARVRDVLRHDS